MSDVHGYGAYMQWEQQQLTAPWFMATVRELFPEKNGQLCTDPTRQKSGIDVLLTNRNPEDVPPWDRREFTLDAKFRRKAYNDFIVEIKHEGPTVNMLGWGLRGLACDYMLYVVLATAQATLIHWPQWWRWWLSHRHELSVKYPLQQAKNRSYTTHFVTLPWSLFADVPMRTIPLVGYTGATPVVGVSSAPGRS